MSEERCRRYRCDSSSSTSEVFGPTIPELDAHPFDDYVDRAPVHLATVEDSSSHRRKGVVMAPRRSWIYAAAQAHLRTHRDDSSHEDDFEPDDFMFHIDSLALRLNAISWYTGGSNENHAGVATHDDIVFRARNRAAKRKKKVWRESKRCNRRSTVSCLTTAFSTLKL